MKKTIRTRPATGGKFAPRKFKTLHSYLTFAETFEE